MPSAAVPDPNSAELYGNKFRTDDLIAELKLLKKDTLNMLKPAPNEKMDAETESVVKYYVDYFAALKQVILFRDAIKAKPGNRCGTCNEILSAATDTRPKLYCSCCGQLNVRKI